MVAQTHCNGMFPLFLKRTADVIPPLLSVVFRRNVRLGSLFGMFVWVVVRLDPNSERSTVLLSCQLTTDFHNISIV